MQLLVVGFLVIVVFGLAGPRSRGRCQGCPTNVVATANGDGSLTLTWNTVVPSGGFNIPRRFLTGVVR
jgi:hypothetical protein